jgi:hypothetical protein
VLTASWRRCAFSLTSISAILSVVDAVKLALLDETGFQTKVVPLFEPHAASQKLAAPGDAT